MHRLAEPPRCPVCGGVDIVAGHCQHCGSDINKNYVTYKEE